MGILDFLFGSSDEESKKENLLDKDKAYSGFDVGELKESPIVNERWIGEKVWIPLDWINRVYEFENSIQLQLMSKYDYENWEKNPYTTISDKNKAIIIGFLSEKSKESRSSSIEKIKEYPLLTLDSTPLEDMIESSLVKEISESTMIKISGSGYAKANSSGFADPNLTDGKIIFQREKVLRWQNYDFKKRLKLHEDFPKVDEEIFIDPLEEDISIMYDQIKSLRNDSPVDSEEINKINNRIDEMLEEYNIDHSN